MTIIKHIYFYLFAAVGLVFILIGLVMLIQLGLRAWVFPQADQYIAYPAPRTAPDAEKETQEPTRQEIEEYQQKELVSRRQREATNGIAFLIVGIPLFAFHFRTIKRQLKHE